MLILLLEVRKKGFESVSSMVDADRRASPLTVRRSGTIRRQSLKAFKSNGSPRMQMIIIISIGQSGIVLR